LAEDDSLACIGRQYAVQHRRGNFAHAVSAVRSGYREAQPGFAGKQLCLHARAIRTRQVRCSETFGRADQRSVRAEQGKIDCCPERFLVVVQQGFARRRAGLRPRQICTDQPRTAQQQNIDLARLGGCDHARIRHALRLFALRRLDRGKQGDQTQRQQRHRQDDQHLGPGGEAVGSEAGEEGRRRRRRRHAITT